MKGLRQFFHPPTLATPRLTVNGIGVREAMQPGIVDRPAGTADFLFMLFYERVDLVVGGRPATLPGRTLVLWAPGQRHCYGNAERTWRHTWVHCQGSGVRRLLRTLRLLVGRPLLDVDPAPAERYLLSLYEELTGSFAPDETIAMNHLENWLREVTRRRASRIRGGPPEPLVRLRTYLDLHSAEPIRLSDLAARAALSPPYLCTLFKRHFGVSPIDYVIRQRLQRAEYLLHNQNLAIGEVGRLVGYDDIFQFSKLFKKRFGESPRSMRRRIWGSPPSAPVSAGRDSAAMRGRP
jgi:AraC-like DNA-binding protein